jgi:hypothetical protein
MFRYLLCFAVLTSVSACQSIRLSPGAELVRLTHNEPGKECQFLGEITGNQGDFFTGEFTSNENLETGARHDAKNKAFAMGGNVIYILTHRAGQTSNFDPEFGGGSAQTNVTLSGNVYRCFSG